MEIALESEEGNLLDKIPTAVIVKLLKQKDKFQTLFNKHDRSGDGQLQRKELQSCFKELGIELSPAEIGELLHALDRDGNGEIDTKELLRALEDTETAHVLENARFENVEDLLRREWVIAHGGIPKRKRRSRASHSANEVDGPQNEEEEETGEEDLKTELCRLMYHAKTEHTLLLKYNKLKVLKFGKSRKTKRDKSKATMSRRRGE